MENVGYGFMVCINLMIDGYEESSGELKLDGSFILMGSKCLVISKTHLMSKCLSAK